MTSALAPRGLAARTVAERLSPAALVLVVLVHLGVFAALASRQGISVPAPASALMVEVFQDPITAPKAPAVAPAKPEAAATPPKSVAQPAVLPVAQQAKAQPTLAPAVLATESAQAAPAFEAARPEKAAAALANTAPAAQANQANPANAAFANAPSAAASPAAATVAAAATAPRLDADYLDNPAPSYPPLSTRAREEGRVLLHVLVEASGLAARVEVRTSSGFERLDRSAMAAVKRWKFVPAKQGSEPVAAWVLVPIVFSLKG